MSLSNPIPFVQQQKALGPALTWDEADILSLANVRVAEVTAAHAFWHRVVPGPLHALFDTDQTRFHYDAWEQCYKDSMTGQCISDALLRSAVEKVIAEERRKTRDDVQQLIRFLLSLADFQMDLAASIKEVHLTLALLAAGGTLSIDEQTILEKYLQAQYAYLNRMAAQIAQRKQPLNGNLLVRVDLYMHAARGTYQNLLRERAGRTGRQQEKRILGIADHCPTCLQQAALGWQPIGTLNPIGMSECLSNCHCHFVFQ